jgi:hypothetical protein
MIPQILTRIQVGTDTIDVHIYENKYEPGKSDPYEHWFGRGIASTLGEAFELAIECCKVDYPEIFCVQPENGCTCDARFSGNDEAEYRARGCPDCTCRTNEND